MGADFSGEGIICEKESGGWLRLAFGGGIGIVDVGAT